MKINFTFFLFFFCFSVFSQAYKTPLTTDFYIQFSTNQYEELQNAEILQINAVLQEYDFIFEKASYLTEEKMQYLEEQAIKNVGNADAINALKRLQVLRIKGILSDDKKDTVYKNLRRLSFIDAVQEKNNEPVPPPTDIPPTTPNLFASQTYIQANPGVNMQYAWNNGYTGTNINIRDVEYGLNVNHEEFNSTNASIATGMTVNSNATTAYTEHGTAAIGVMFADYGTYGVSGMVYGASEAVLYPEWTNENGYNRNYAVSQAINNSVAGDVIVYEMQTGGVGGSNDYVPAEYTLSIWNLTKAATDAGIVIVAAAGNGEQNLDSSSYTSYMSRGDSGAIIVGAGSSNTTHSRLYYSTYGSRVNLQGWGQNVLAPGYGDYAAYGGDFNQQYTMFSGTSSATPIVASCAVILQSISFNATGNYLTCQQIRDILIQTGIPQGGNTAQNIGPLPDMQAAINLLLSNLATENFNEISLNLYPNPTTNNLIIQNYDDNLIGSDAIIYNALGQNVLNFTLRSNKTQLDVSQLQSGIYWVQIANGKQTKNLKFIKQ